MATRAFNVALLGMGEKSLSTFTYFLRKQASRTLKLDIARNADVFIVDYDSKEGKAQWKEFCSSPSKPAIVLAAENPNTNNTIWVRKPVSSNDLSLAIPKLIELAENPHTAKNISSAEQEAKYDNQRKVDISSREKKGTAGYKREFADDFSPNLTLSKDEVAELCGDREDMDFTSKEFASQATFSEQNTILSFVKKVIQTAQDKKVLVHLDGLPFQFAVLGDSGRVLVDLNNRHLRHLCAIALPQHPRQRLESVPAAKFKEVLGVSEQALPTIEQVLWQIALWTARGRLTQSVSANSILRLSYWPNFTRLTITPHALQIAAILVNNDMTVEEVSQTLRIPQRYIFSIVTASYAVGLVEQKEDRRVAIRFGQKERPNFFNTILRSLKLA